MAKTKKQETGSWGEEVAVTHLTEGGYTILERNWRSGRAEIDIIAKTKHTLVFLEVKVRRNSAYGYPETFVSAQQVFRVKTAASQYQFEKNYDGFIRFDIVSILGSPKQYEVLHLEDAF